MPPDRPLFRPSRRLLGYCVLIGIAGGLAALGFDALVELAQRYLLEGVGRFAPPAAGAANPLVPPSTPFWSRWWLPVVTTLGGLLSGLLVFRLAPEAEGHGTDAAISAYHAKGGWIRPRIPFVKALASALTIGSGGVAGKEGPTAQIAVGLGSILSRLTGLRGQERRALLLAGMAAGLAAIFRAPLGMAIFAVEILYSGMAFEAEALIYTVIAAVSAYATQGIFSGWEHLFWIPSKLSFHEPESLIGFVVLGLAAGLFGAVLPAAFYRVRDLFRRLPGPPHLRPALGGLLVGLLGMAVPELLGTGYGWLQLAMVGQLSLTTILLLLVLKVPGLALTVGSGGSGGVFGPTVVMGAMLGAAVGMGVHLALPAVEIPAAAFVVVGMAAVFAGAARAPISTLILTVEMTGGYGLIVPAMLANVLAFLTQRSLTARARYPTLYESQVERPEDSPTHRGVFVRRAVEMLERGDLESTELTLPKLASLLRFGEPIPISDERYRLVRVEVRPGSALDGRTVAESVGGLAGVTAVAVLRQEEMLMPRGPTMLHGGDQVLAVTTPESQEMLEAFAAGVEDEPNASRERQSSSRPDTGRGFS